MAHRSSPVPPVAASCKATIFSISHTALILPSVEKNCTITASCSMAHCRSQLHSVEACCTVFQHLLKRKSPLPPLGACCTAMSFIFSCTAAYHFFQWWQAALSLFSVFWLTASHNSLQWQHTALAHITASLALSSKLPPVATGALPGLLASLALHSPLPPVEAI